VGLFSLEEVGPHTLHLYRSSSLATHPEGNVGTWTADKTYCITQATANEKT